VFATAVAASAVVAPAAWFAAPQALLLRVTKSLASGDSWHARGMIVFQDSAAARLVVQAGASGWCRMAPASTTRSCRGHRRVVIYVSWRVAWQVYLATLAVLVFGYYTLPVLRPAAIVSVGVVSAAAIVVGVRRMRPERWGAWLLIAAALVLLAAGRATFAARGVPTLATYPDAPEVLFLASYLLLTSGLLWLSRPRLPSRDWPTILDTAILTLAGSFVMWLVLVLPVVADFPLTGAGKVTAIAMWVGHAAVLAAAARLLLVWRTNLTSALLCGGVLTLLVGDFLFAYGMTRGMWGLGAQFDLLSIGMGLLAFGGLCAAAALSPSMADVASLSHARYPLGPGRLMMLAVVLLVGPTALLVQATSGPIAGRIGIALVSASVGVLVLARLNLAVEAYRRRVRRYDAARLVSRALVVATTGDDVIEALRNALTSMLPGGAWSRVRLVEGGRQQVPGATASPCRDVGAVFARGVVVGELGIPVDPQIPSAMGQSRVVVFTASMADLAEVAPVLHTLTEQAGSAMARIALVAALQEAERERYFRTLVLTSTDVILISRNDRIDYATPSAKAMFGRDIRDTSFAQLVTRDPLEQTGRPQPWSDIENGAEAYVRRIDGTVLTVLVHRRDLTADPTVNGVVTTLRDVTAEREAQRSLAYRASHDPLTGLANADQFREKLREESRTATHAASAVLFIDLDDFKGVNDTFGHEIGDGLLTTTANRIRSCLSSRDLAARMGGDEFAVLMPGIPDPDVARAVAQRISDTLAAPATVHGVILDCQASIGLAVASTIGDYGSLLRRADAALYAAKAERKGSWRLYQDGMLNSVRHRTDQRAEIERLMHDDELTLRYQPIVELATGHTAGFEALIRRTGPPDEAAEVERTYGLVRVAEDTGLSVQLGDWVLTQALVDAAKLNPPGTPHTRFVSVNVSARQLRQRDFVDRVRDLLTTTGVSGSSLIIEVTENVLVHEDERAWTYLGDLRRDGVRVAIDDYGTGYASLNYLRQHAIDIVKIARDFLRDIHSRRTQTLLDALIGPIMELGLDPIAEGIEDTQTADALLALRCRYGQGFLYAPAMPIEDAVTVHRFHTCDCLWHADRSAPQREAPSN
jgi:diguanylate cyclase (GGDEF)-like protein/PAS domain S-box-containing protein